MKGILYALLICFIARSATAQNNCNLGRKIIDKVDNRIIDGTWYVGLNRPKSLSQESPCEVDTYVPRPDGNSDFTSQDENEAVTGVVEIVDDNKLNYTYNLDNFDVSEVYDVLGWSEEDEYLILAGCLEGEEDDPVVQVSFKQLPPKESSLEAAKAAIVKVGLNPEDFAVNCE